MSEILFWAADNIDLWRSFAIEALAAISIGCLTFAASMWEEMT